MFGRHESLRAIARALGSTVPTVKRALEVPDTPKPLDPNRLVSKLITIPAKHMDGLKSLAAARGIPNTTDLIRTIIRKELELAGAALH